MDAKEREAKKVKGHLKTLVEEVTAFLSQIDAAMKGPAITERGQTVARLCNDLDVAKDRARFFGLGIDYRTGKPRKVTAAKGGAS